MTRAHSPPNPFCEAVPEPMPSLEHLLSEKLKVRLTSSDQDYLAVYISREMLSCLSGSSFIVKSRRRHRFEDAMVKSQETKMSFLASNIRFDIDRFFSFLR